MRLPRGSTAGIDTTALIAAFDRDDEGHRQSRELIEALRDGRLRGVISAIAAAESLVRPLRRRLYHRAAAIQTLLLTLPNVELAPVDWRTAVRGAELRAAHGIQLADALILASAMGCDAFVSADRRALAVAKAEGLETLALGAG